MLQRSPFWFKRVAQAAPTPQRNITLAQVQTPGSAVATDIVALFNLNDNKVNSDPNALTIYGTWAGTPEIYGSHLGILSDNGFSKFLDGNGLQVSNWGAGSADTFYNNDGVTFSWIARPVPASGARLMQYVQADLEYIELYFLDVDTIRLAVILGTGTLQFDDVLVATVGVNDGNFHHFVVTFHPGAERIARLYIDGVLACETLAVAGVATFGSEAVNIKRGIGFGCSYSAPDADFSGDVDHCTILRGMFPTVITGLDGRMLYNGSFMKYYAGQMYYNGNSAPAPGDVLYGAEDVLYQGQPVAYSNIIGSFASGTPYWLSY